MRSSVWILLLVFLIDAQFSSNAFMLKNVLARFFKPVGFQPELPLSSPTPSLLTQSTGQPVIEDVIEPIVAAVSAVTTPSYPPAQNLAPTTSHDQQVALGAHFKELDQNTRTMEKGQRRFRPLITARIVSWALHKIITLRTDVVQGLDIKIASRSNYDVLRGRLDTIDMKFDKISFAQLHVSGGGRFIIKGLELRMRRFLFFNLQSVKKPYVIYADLLLTQQDIINSKVIRNLIQLLVNTILERILQNDKILSASVRKVTINARRINAQGTVKVLSDRVDDSSLISLDFEISTGAGMRDNGHVLFLKDVQATVALNSRLRTSVPYLATRPIDIDLGEDCIIENLVIANKNIWIRAASVISPITPFSVAEMESKALYRYDLSALLSSLLRLNGGIFLRWMGA